MTKLIVAFRNFANPCIKIWRMHIACWVPKSSNTRSEYLILLFHSSSGYATDPPCYLTCTIVSLVYTRNYAETQLLIKYGRVLYVPIVGSLAVLQFTLHSILDTVLILDQLRGVNVERNELQS